MASLYAVAAAAGVSRTEPRPETGRWSAAAKRVDTPPAGNLVVAAPDGSKRAVAEGADLWIEIEDRRILRAPLATPAELLWSPDSSALAVTASDGGEEGTWLASVFRVTSASAEVADPTRAAVEDFLPRFKCADPEIPHVGAAAWIGGSSRLLLVARAPDRRGCSDRGLVVGYEVEFPSGRILQVLDAAQLLARHRARLGSLAAGL